MTLIAAMSGGVDSSIAAALAREQGYTVIGVTLRLFDCDTPGRQSECCGMNAHCQAEAAAAALHLRHHSLDCRKDFREQILRYAWEEYRRGRTPNPCAWCNYHLKFGLLQEYAASRGAAGIITGHYAVICRDHDTVALQRSKNPDQDQSYFLFALHPEQLRQIHTPLGKLTKTEVRKRARKLGLPNAERKASQDACFASGTKTSFAQTLQRFFGEKSRPGDVVNRQGRRLAAHNGIHNFTIGQRRGLGVALGSPAYVTAINPDTGTVTVSTNPNDLNRNSLIVANLNWQQPEYADTQFACQVQIRYQHQPVKAEIMPLDKHRAQIKFAAPQRAVTPGQAAVFYHNNTLLGGGWIE